MSPATLTSLFYLVGLALIFLFCIFVKVKIRIRVVVSFSIIVVTFLNSSSDKSIVQDITNATKPPEIIIKESNPEQINIGTANWNRVEINGKEYKIKDICYTGPLNWTPFQKWTILEVR